MEEQTLLRNLIRAAGIQVQRAPDNAGGWDYAIPAIQRGWYGPYPTEAEAIAAAVQFLILCVQQIYGEHPPIAVSGRAKSQQREEATFKQILQQRLGRLQREAAHQGVDADPAIAVEIEDIQRQLAR